MSILNSKIHPDFQKLLDRYQSDPRFEGKEPDRQTCINYLIALNNWIQVVEKPSEIQAVLLSGSFSSLKKDTPDLREVINGPWFGNREGGSDLDVLFLYASNIAGLLKLKWLNFNIPERESTHPDDFEANAYDTLKLQLRENCSEALINRVEIHVAVLTPTLGELALKKYIRHMISTGTLIWGDLQSSNYGKYREDPPSFNRPASDSIINLMGGGF